MDSKPTILEEAPIPIYELKDEINKIKKRDTELNFRAAKTEEYLSQFTTLGPRKGKEFIDEIAALNIPRLKAEHIYKIADILPADLESVKLVLQGYTLTVSQENMKKIAEIVKKYV
jgi:DNA-directed RNA polymerase subunit F